jgi:hypothetical protein
MAMPSGRIEEAGFEPFAETRDLDGSSPATSQIGEKEVEGTGSAIVGHAVAMSAPKWEAILLSCDC